MITLTPDPIAHLAEDRGCIAYPMRNGCVDDHARSRAQYRGSSEPGPTSYDLARICARRLQRLQDEFTEAALATGGWDLMRNLVIESQPEFQS